MAKPWIIIESAPTPDGILELRQRDTKDFLIMIGPQVLMNSQANRSEIVLGQLACSHLNNSETPRVLIGGLGMGFTLKAVLDCLPVSATVIIAELNPVVCQWCQGPLAILTDQAVSDPRVKISIGDVANYIRKSAVNGNDQRFDAIVLDLYRGPHAQTHKQNDPLYGSRAIDNAKAALKPGGILTVWGESYDEGFEKRLKSAGFTVTCERPGKGGLRHVVFVAKLQIKK